MQILLNDEDRQTLGQAENSPAGWWLESLSRSILPKAAPNQEAELRGLQLRVGRPSSCFWKEKMWCYCQTAGTLPCV